MLTTSVQRYQIQTKILNFLYEKPHQSQRTELLKILEEHEKMTGTTAFLYKGKLYGRRSKKPATRLQSGELSERMDALLEQDRALSSEKSYVISYISAILNLNAYAGTYVSLLPSVVHGIIRAAVPNFDGEAREVAEEDMERLRKFNTKGEKFFKQRILKNAVME